MVRMTRLLLLVGALVAPVSAVYDVPDVKKRNKQPKPAVSRLEALWGSEWDSKAEKHCWRCVALCSLVSALPSLQYRYSTSHCGGCPTCCGAGACVGKLTPTD